MSPVTTHGPQGVLVAVAHGSAVPRAAATIADLMTVVAERAARRGVHIPDLRTAYLGHATPSLPQVMSTRAVPFYCPYCGEEDLEPRGATDGQWHCRSCTRTFQLNMTHRRAA